MEVSLDEDQAEVVSEASADAVAEEEPISEEAAEEAAFVSENLSRWRRPDSCSKVPQFRLRRRDTLLRDTLRRILAGAFLWARDVGMATARMGPFSPLTGGLVSARFTSEPLRHRSSRLPGRFSAQYFVGVPPDPSVSVVAKAKNMAATNRWPTGSVIALDVAPNTDPIADQSSVQPIGFETTVLLDDSNSWNCRPPPSIFPLKIPTWWCWPAAARTVRLLVTRNGAGNRSARNNSRGQ